MIQIDILKDNVDLMARNDIQLISDEIYSGSIFEGDAYDLVSVVVWWTFGISATSRELSEPLAPLQAAR